MNAGSLAYCVGAAALAIVGLKSIAVLARVGSPWTLAGWAFSTLYCVLIIGRLIAQAPALPFHIEYVALALMVVAFLVAGIRREPQADPWWWPSRTKR